MKLLVWVIAISVSTAALAGPPSKKIEAKIQGEVLRNFYQANKGEFVKISNLWITENEETGGYFGHISYTDLEFQDVPDCYSTGLDFDRFGRPTGGNVSSSKCARP